VEAVYSPQGMGFTGALGCPGSCKLDLLQCAVDLVLGDGNSCVAGAAKLATAVGCSLVLEWKILACRGSCKLVLLLLAVALVLGLEVLVCLLPLAVASVLSSSQK